MTSARSHRLRRTLAVLAASLALPAAFGASPAAAFTGDVDHSASAIEDGSLTLAPGPGIAAAPDGEPDVLMAGDLIRRLRPDPAPCTYADKSYSNGSVVKMDGGVLRECSNGSWVPYQAPNKS